MYKCDQCGANSTPSSPCRKVVTQRAWVFHPERLRANKGFAIQKNGKKKKVWLPDPGGWGFQIAREERMCNYCANLWEHEHRESLNATA